MKLILLFLLANISYSQLNAELIARDFEKPLYVTNYPNDNNRLILIEQEGIVKIVNEKIPFLDISDRVHQPLYPADEMGMLGLAFDPNFDKNNTFYVHYNDKDNNTIVSSFRTINGYGKINSEQIL